MSELINKNDNRATIRWKLLTGASALALAYTSSLGSARAEDATRPAIWVELGGQLSQLQDSQETFSPPLMDGRPSIFEPSQKFERPPRFSFDEHVGLSFQPDDSSWVFSASVQYGRSRSYRDYQQQTSPSTAHKYILGSKHIRYPVAEKFAETSVRNSERHTILDFQAGKDVGLGLFGQDSSSLLSLGVRFAQFKGKSNFTLKSDPDWHFIYKYTDIPPYFYNLEFIKQAFHSNLASLTAERSFRGVGPSVSWKSSVALAGNAQDGEIVADWGINAALLFGRQKAHTHHQSTRRYGYVKYSGKPVAPYTTTQFAPPDRRRSRNVTVPNVGGFAGISYRYEGAKISFGYKADFFFNAIDGGIDARKSENRGFFGPYASVSIGIGD